MLRYDIRFWDKENKRMIYGAGISPTQLPIVKHEDGRLEELQGEFLPMICTGQKATNGQIWEGDVIECDVPALVVEGMPVSYVRARGVMQYHTGKGMFTVGILGAQDMQGAEFRVTNSRIIGCAISNPELLQANTQNNEKVATDGSESAPKDGAGREDTSA